MVKRQNNIVVRKVNNLTIVFYNPRTIYIKHKYGIVVYHRWLIRKRGFYSKNWRPFSESLKQHKNIDIYYINSLAERYEIEVEGCQKMPNLTKKIKIIPNYGRKRNSH